MNTLFEDNYVSRTINYTNLDVFGNIRIQKGIKIGFLDTGCAEHECFNGVNIKRHTVLENDNGIDTFGHGTFFAGVLANYCYHGGIIDPEIISIKVSNVGKIKIPDILKGIELAISLNVDVLNIGMCNFYFYEEIAKMIKCASDRGIIVVSPAGNHLNGELTFPACLDNVISCASIDENENIAEHSNLNFSVNVLAPGKNIVGPLIKGCPGFDNSRLIKEGFTTLDGTSFASAIVSALAVIIKAIDINVRYKKFLTLIEICSNKKRVPINGNINEITIIDFKEMISNLINNKIIRDKEKDSKFWKLNYTSDKANSYLIKGTIYNSYGEIVELDNEDIKTEVYRNMFNDYRKKTYIRSIAMKSKNGYFEILVDELNFGMYSIKISSENTESSIITIVNLPEEPKIEYEICDRRVLFEFSHDCDCKVYYSFNEKMISVMNGQPLDGTFLYEKELVVDIESISKINYASFSQGVFSKLNSIKVE